MSKPEFIYVTYIATTPDRLWRALTDAEFTKQYWMDCELISDWKVGSKMTMSRYGEVKNECVIREADPPRRLAYDWVSVHDPEMKREKPSRVTYLLEPHGDLVKLTVYLYEFDPYPQFNEATMQHFADTVPPTRSVLVAPEITGSAKIVIDAVALAP